MKKTARHSHLAYMWPLAGVLMWFSIDSIAQGVTTPSAVQENIVPATSLKGTLFFSPQQRERMERARKTGVAETELNDEPERSIVNGFVKRSDGYSAIWVDGQPRFNVQDESVRQLQPTDVGGSNNVVRVSSGNKPFAATTIATPAPAHHRTPVRKTKSAKPAKKLPQGMRKLE